MPAAKKDSSVADNARDAVLLHVSASCERQERTNETGAMTKTTERHILTHSDACSTSVLYLYSRASGSASYIVHYARARARTHTHTHTSTV
jgi:hypothetical protein